MTALAAPPLADVGIIAFVPEEWENIGSTRYYVLTRLSRYFRVVWLNPSFGWRELWRGSQAAEFGRAYRQEVLPGLTVYNPGRWLPEVWSPRWVGHLVRRERLRRARRILEAQGCHKILLSIWLPEWAYALDLVDHDLSVYHIVDEYTFADTEHPVPAAEARLISRVDQVFLTSAELFAKKGPLNPNSQYVSNGVEFRAFATPVSEPEDLRAIPRPRIGYVGVVKPQLDFELLLALAKRHREWSFVMVGPRQKLDSVAALVTQLEALPNVHFLGSKPVDTLPAYAQHLDVCTLGYALTGYTKFIYPLKLHEYLATGRPVVGTPIPALEPFREVVRLAATLDDWSEALEESLKPEAMAPAKVARRLAVARAHDWDHLVERMAGRLCERLGPSFSKRFQMLEAARATVIPNGGNP